MKTAYQITVKSDPVRAKSISIPARLLTMGNTITIFQGMNICSWLLVRDNQAVDARYIRDELLKLINPFTERLLVVRVNTMDVSAYDFDQQMAMLDICRTDNGKEPRNFERFSTKEEAIAAYQSEKPHWVQAEGFGIPMEIPFEDWCWLPMNQNGVYESGKFDNYLN